MLYSSTPPDTTTPPQHSLPLANLAEHRSDNEWDEIVGDENQRHNRLTQNITPGRPILTGTDSSHELVYLVNQHPLLASEVAADDGVAPQLTAAPEQEESHENIEESRPQNVALNPLKTDSAVNTKSVSEAEAAHDTAPLSAEHNEAGQASAPVQHQVEIAAKHLPEQHHEPAAHPVNVIHTAHAAEEHYQGISQHDTHLSDLIARDTLPATGDVGYALESSAQSTPTVPAVSDLLLAPETPLFSGEVLATAEAAPSLELTDLLGGEAPGSWNSHQPAMDEGVLHMMPEYVPVELEQTDLHQLF